MDAGATSFRGPGQVEVIHEAAQKALQWWRQQCCRRPGKVETAKVDGSPAGPMEALG